MGYHISSHGVLLERDLIDYHAGALGKVKGYEKGSPRDQSLSLLSHRHQSEFLSDAYHINSRGVLLERDPIDYHVGALTKLKGYDKESPEPS